METSDSEYFESADEDFDSDYEEEKSKPQQLVGQKLGHKIIEPEVCKLKKREETIEPKNKEQKESNLKDGQKISISQSSSEESGINSIVSKEGSNKNLVTTKKNEINEERSLDTRDNVEIIKDKPAENLVKNDDTEIDTIITAPEVVDKTLVSNNAQNISPQTETKEEPKVLSEEENLWNDDEIDWESEAVKEEIQKNEKPGQNLKNEDSGWDDFEAEWESESPVSTEQSNNGSFIPKLNTQELRSDTSPNINATSAKESLWDDDDDWEPLEKPEDKPKQSEEQSSWGGWGSWGVSTLLNTATQGVSSLSSLTSHVSQGLSTVLESGIGIPDPEEMARINSFNKEQKMTKDEQKRQEIKDNSDDSPVFGLDNLVSGMSQITKFVESTGTKVITGGLDTLEAIGKKTVEVLQEGDPGLKKKRALLKLDTGKPNLSQILREAKEKAEEEHQTLNQKYNEVKKPKNYEALFDDHQGLVHLEALEMLSKLCSIKLSNLNNSLSGSALKEMQETLEQVKEICELPEDEEDEKISLEEGKEIITNAVKEIDIPISYDKLFLTCNESDTWLENLNLNFIDDSELHQQAIETLAQLTAFAVEQFHKTGELLMVKDHRSTANEADSLVQITCTLKSLILGQAGKFTDKLSSMEKANKDSISEHITNIFFEAANSGRYIQDAFQLLIPVLQVGAV